MKLTRVILSVVFVCLCSASIFAQDSQLSETQDKYTKANVYVYRAPQARTQKQRASFPVYANDTLLATLDAGRYVHAKLDPGTYNFGAKNSKQRSAGFEVKSGETYYLRVEYDNQKSGREARVTLMPKEKGAIEVRQMSPIATGDIKDRSLVVDESSPKEPTEPRP